MVQLTPGHLIQSILCTSGQPKEVNSHPAGRTLENAAIEECPGTELRGTPAPFVLSPSCPIGRSLAKYFAAGASASTAIDRVTLFDPVGMAWTAATRRKP